MRGIARPILLRKLALKYLYIVEYLMCLGLFIQDIGGDVLSPLDYLGVLNENDSHSRS